MTSADQYREYLGGTQLTAAATSMTVTIAPREAIIIEVWVTSFSVADIPALQFNSDTGNNYLSRFMSYAAGTATPTNVATNTTSMARLGANTSTKSQIYNVGLANPLPGGKTKVGQVHLYVGSGAAGTTAPIVFGGIEWVNTTTPITTIKLLSVSGNSFGIGSGIRVTGGDFL